MEERIIEVPQQFFDQLAQLLTKDEQTMSNEHADTHGTNYVLWTQNHKRLVFVRRRAQVSAVQP